MRGRSGGIAPWCTCFRFTVILGVLSLVPLIVGGPVEAAFIEGFEAPGDVAFLSPVSRVPEPGRLAVLGVGLAGLVVARRRARAWLA